MFFDGDSVSSQTIGEVIAEEVGVENFEEGLNAFERWLQEVPDKLVRFGVKFGLALLFFFIGSKIIKLVRKIFKKTLTKSGADIGVIQFLDSFIKVILYILLFVAMASYFGIQTTGLVTIIGSAGVAFALALQGSLSNFTGGVLLLILKPFRVGDYIIEGSGNKEGTVVGIQLFYTKLRTVDDKIIVLPNGSLANTSIVNLNLTPIRRICLKVGISYNSDIKLAKNTIHDVIEAESKVLREHAVDVYVDELADSAVVIGFRFYVNNEDYWSVRWETLEKVKLALDEAGVEIPFAQIDVHVDNK